MEVIHLLVLMLFSMLNSSEAVFSFKNHFVYQNIEDVTINPEFLSVTKELNFTHTIQALAVLEKLESEYQALCDTLKFNSSSTDMFGNMIVLCGNFTFFKSKEEV